MVWISRLGQGLEHVPPVASRAQLVRMPAMDDDLRVLGEEAHCPCRAGASHCRQHQWLQTWLETGLDRLMTEGDAAQSRSCAMTEHRAHLEINPWFETEHAHRGAKPACPCTGRIRVIPSDVGPLPVQRGLANDGAALMDF